MNKVFLGCLLSVGAILILAYGGIGLYHLIYTELSCLTFAFYFAG